MKVLTVVGARPQFVKAFPVSRALQEDHEEVLVHTGQHYDEGLSDVFFDELDIEEPTHNLAVGSAPHGRQTGTMMTRIEEVMEEERPDAVLVYGDTNSTVAGALVAAKRSVPVAHVEAGLRSFDRSMPEEINRVVTDHVADQLFAPTRTAMENLAREGLRERAHWTGDVMYDAMLWARDVAREESTVHADLELTPDEYAVATVHRAGNTDDPDRLRSILRGLTGADLDVVLPIHPRTHECLDEYGLWERAARDLRIVDPVGYLDFVRLVDGARRVATDSGGVQKEAFFLETPCVTMREETEWVETVDAGWNVLVGADADLITEGLTSHTAPDDHDQPFGDGTAAEHVADLLATAGEDG